MDSYPVFIPGGELCPCRWNRGTGSGLGCPECLGVVGFVHIALVRRHAEMISVITWERYDFLLWPRAESNCRHKV